MQPQRLERERPILARMQTLAALWLTLSTAERVGPVRLKALAKLHGGAAGLAQAVHAGRLDPDGRSDVRIDHVDALASLRVVLAPEARKRAAGLVRAWAAAGTDLVHPEHAAYPSILAAIYDPPPVLFVRGAVPPAALAPYQDARTVAIVGTRRASPWGEAFAARLARDLTDAGVVVVSGLALGIDGAAHRGALEAGGQPTLAVLGSGPDRVHPPAHRALARSIEGRGAVLGEHPPGTNARATYFPRRNRIVSGLARAVVVVEAPERSGARITVDFALDEGRSVFCVPQRPDSAHGRGALSLLASGASPVGSASDLLDALGWRAPPGEGADARVHGPLQRHVMDALLRLGGGGIEAVSPPGATPGAVLAALTELEVAGRVRPDGNGGWRPS